MIRFDVSALVKARPGTSLTLELELGPQSLTDLEVGYLRGSVQVTRVQNGLLVQGIVESQLKLGCVRCLDSFTLPVALELEELFQIPGAKPKPDIPYAVNGDGTIDLAPLVRELAWVAIPLKVLCSPDCKGFCPECGANLNSESCACDRLRIDPRWASLRELL
jgi:uncharacterized protein